MTETDSPLPPLLAMLALSIGLLETVPPAAKHTVSSVAVPVIEVVITSSVNMLLLYA